MSDSRKWFDILHAPIGSRSVSIGYAALRAEQLNHDRTQTRLNEALNETAAARKVLAILIQQTGGKVTVTDRELEELNLNAVIHSQHDSARNESTFWVEAIR